MINIKNAIQKENNLLTHNYTSILKANANSNKSDIFTNIYSNKIKNALMKSSINLMNDKHKKEIKKDKNKGIGYYSFKNEESINKNKNNFTRSFSTRMRGTLNIFQINQNNETEAVVDCVKPSYTLNTDYNINGIYNNLYSEKPSKKCLNLKKEEGVKVLITNESLKESFHLKSKSFNKSVSKNKQSEFKPSKSVVKTFVRFLCRVGCYWRAQRTLNLIIKNI